jgi:hypothetical protein
MCKESQSGEHAGKMARSPSAAWPTTNDTDSRKNRRQIRPQLLSMRLAGFARRDIKPNG